MTEPKWTPGPWENQGEDLFADVPFIRIGDGYRSTSICEVLPPIDAEEPDEETCANANLIAAAPDLYEATDWVERVSAWEFGDDVHEESEVPVFLTVGEIRALIDARRRARGE